MSTFFARRRLCLRGCSLLSLLPLAVGAMIFPKLTTSQTRESKASKRIIATVAGQAVYEDDLPAALLGQLQETRQHEFDLEMKGLEEIVRQRLLVAEANKRGLTSDQFLREEIDKKVTDPSPGEVEAFYLGQKDHERQTFDEVKVALQLALKQARIQAARDAFLHSLQQSGEVLIFLQRPRIEVSYDSARLKGSPAAPVIIVEFSDFSCPFCRQAESTLGTLLAKYRGKVSLAYRDFPLRQVHLQAELAAEASRCAMEQGKYWDYHDLLFTSGDKLRRDELLQHARELTLDDKRFASCLDTGLYKSQVEKDVEDGMRAGVTATPAFFINGIFLKGAQPSSSFEEIIDRELANQAGSKPSASK
jgi:protein-disulfide isomerase